MKYKHTGAQCDFSFSVRMKRFRRGMSFQRNRSGWNRKSERMGIYYGPSSVTIAPYRCTLSESLWIDTGIVMRFRRRRIMEGMCERFDWKHLRADLHAEFERMEWESRKRKNWAILLGTKWKTVWRVRRNSRCQIANNNSNLSHNYLDGGMYVQSPELMGIWLSVYCGNGYRRYLQPLIAFTSRSRRLMICCFDLSAVWKVSLNLERRQHSSSIIAIQTRYSCLVPTGNRAFNLQSET